MNAVDQHPGEVLRDCRLEACETLDALLRAAACLRLRLCEFLEPFSLTEGRHSVLVALKSAGMAGLSQSELAERLMQSESNISTLVERMQNEVLIERSRSEADRRKWVLLLSVSGDQLLSRVEEARSRWAARQLRGIPADDRSTFGALIGQLNDSLDDRAKSQVTPAAATRKPVHHDGETHWIEHRADEGGDEHSPHLALQRMLSALGLIYQYAEDEA